MLECVRQKVMINDDDRMRITVQEERVSVAIKLVEMALQNLKIAKEKLGEEKGKLDNLTKEIFGKNIYVKDNDSIYIMKV